MQNSKNFTVVAKGLIVLISLSFIFIGIRTIVSWTEVPKGGDRLLTKDSSYSKNTTNDPAKKISVTTTEIKTTTSSSRESLSANETTLKDNMTKKGYDLALVGILIFLLLIIFPYLSEFSILSLFTAKFRNQVEAGKAIINDAANATNTNVPVEKPKIEQVQVPETQVAKLRNIVAAEEVEVGTISKYSIDPQKGKWGGLSERNDRKLTASVTPLAGSKQLFKVILRVLSTNVKNPLRGKVLFHLHATFPNPDPEIYVLQGEARLELIAWGAFTVGAQADNGTTELELDLSELPEAPLLFKSR